MASEFERELMANLPSLKKYVNLKLHKKREEAEDIIQETCLRAWRAQSQYDPTISTMFTWLSVIARNITREDWREGWDRNKVVGDVYELTIAHYPDQSPSAEDHLMVCDVLEDVEKRLPKRQSFALQAKVMGHCEKDIAQQLNTTVMAVKMCIHHGRTTIREIHSETYEEIAA